MCICVEALAFERALPVGAVVGLLLHSHAPLAIFQRHGFRSFIPHKDGARAAHR
jgi:hypothetical protein